MKEPPQIKPADYRAHLFYNFHRWAGHATKEYINLKNIIQDLHDKGNFKFDHEVLDKVLNNTTGLKQYRMDWCIPKIKS